MDKKNTMTSNVSRIASHRGGTLEFGDSTLLGFRATAAMAVDEVEFDLHPTCDGAIMVHHDATLDRTTDTSGVIAKMTEAEVRAATINYGAGSHPISLPDLCACFRDSCVDFRCEVKGDASGAPYSNFVPKVVSLLHKEGMLDRTVFSSFMLEVLDEFSAACDRPRLWLVSPFVMHQLGLETLFEIARSHGLTELAFNADMANADLKARVIEASFEFGCWGAHKAELIEKMFVLGVKVFTSDRPSLAIELRKRFLERRVA